MAREQVGPHFLVNDGNRCSICLVMLGYFKYEKNIAKVVGKPWFQ
jgi:hypothetical protein